MEGFVEGVFLRAGKGEGEREGGKRWTEFLFLIICWRPVCELQEKEHRRSLPLLLSSYIGCRARQAIHLLALAIEQIDKHLRDPLLVMLPLPEKVMSTQIPAINEVGCRGSGMREEVSDDLGPFQGVVLLL